MEGFKYGAKLQKCEQMRDLGTNCIKLRDEMMWQSDEK